MSGDIALLLEGHEPSNDITSTIECLLKNYDEAARNVGIETISNRANKFENCKISNEFENYAHILVSMRGPHGTDIMTALLNCLARAPLNIVIKDSTFSRIHHQVTFSTLLKLSMPLIKTINHLSWMKKRSVILEWCNDLQLTARKWSATLLLDVLPNVLPSALGDAPYANRGNHAATLLGPPGGLTPEILARMGDFLLKYHVSVLRMKRLDRPFLTNDNEFCPTPEESSTNKSYKSNENNSESMRCVEYSLSVPETTIIDEFRDGLFRLSRELGADAALQIDNVFRRSKRIVVFDMDSTLIEQEVIDELANFAGDIASKKVHSITERAMKGEIDFAESLRERVAVLLGLNARDAFAAVKERITLRKGARTLCRCLKTVKAELELDYSFANTLGVDKFGILTGKTVGPIVTGERKAELLEVLAQAEGVTLEQVVAVGDGANDLPMLSRAGLGIASNAKPHVQERAKTRVNQENMCSILYLFGYTDDDIATLRRIK